ncbi:metallophosphoesterase [Streptomyces bathyalis]|uniref:Metallophosphoesterase n=1 Tax=Streptomyces bathyalis TaxID=2710756 RepID=A0A7T1T9E3_9ACTN|nr:metallophosphoesterase [Streptomyces bathyalis]QPP08807.1 metallophosphoesterase [Streptomyces bathyalis]
MALLLLNIVAIPLLVTVHWYLWRRLVKDVSREGGRWRRTGTVLVWLLSGTAVGTLIAGPAGAPFGILRVIAWPGYLWLAMLVYLTFALLAGELVRPLLLRWLDRRAAGSPGRSGEEALPDRSGEEAPAVEDLDGDTLTRMASRGSGPEGEPAGEVLAPAGPGPGGEALTRGRKGCVRRGQPAAPAAELGASGHDGPGGEAPGKAGGGGPSRRLFVARTLAIGATAVATTTVATGAVSLLNGPTTRRVTVTLPKLPRSAHGYRIAVVSDVHVGPVLGRGHTRRIVEAINATQPDLVTIVGDVVDGTVEDLAPAVEPLTRLRSRQGTYFVTGNHEYFGDARSWIDHFRGIGIHPLENERREMPGFDLAGVNDLGGEPIGEGPDFEAALGDRDPSRASVLMAHQPVQIHDAVNHGVGLQLSGHTHGGQLWPGTYLARLDNPTVAGLDRYGDTQLYVTRGAGSFGPPIRVGAESDITVVTLASPLA